MRILGLLLLAASALAQEPGRLDQILERANGKDWRERWAAVQALARLPVSDDVFRIRRLLREDERPKVREAIAWACWLDRELGLATTLGRALQKDPDPAVRRGAARALVHFKNRRAVEALIAALGKETDPRTRLWIVETLRAITPAPCLLEPGEWRAWWKRSAHDPRFAPADEGARRGEYEGIVLETKTVAPVRRKGDETRRPPPHLLVLPGFGWNTSVFGPYLLPLRERAAISWVSLPSVQTLTGRSGYGSDIPTYPVERLVRALDKFRESLKLERFVVFAPGASGWIAMRYAQRYPKRCAALVLIDTALDKRAYADALARAAARGDAGERFTAKTLMHQNSAPFNRHTLDRLHAYGLERGFADRADLEIALLYARAREPQGFATVPDIAWSKRARLDVPSLFLYSGASAFSGHVDAGRIQKHFPRSLVAPIREARGLPFVEGNVKFHAVVADFLRRFGLAD